MARLDVTQVAALRRRVESAGGNVAPYVRAAVVVSASKLKRTARGLASGFFGAGSARVYPYSIDYDIKATADEVWAEIGPDKGKPQGALGNLLEYGSENNPGYGHLGEALAATEDDFELGISIAIGDAARAAFG